MLLLGRQPLASRGRPRAEGEGAGKGLGAHAPRTRFPPQSVAAQTAEDEGFILFSETLLQVNV